MSVTLFRFFAVFAGISAGLCHAHLPLESSLALRIEPDGIEMTAVLSEPFARSLLSLPSEAVLTDEVFEQNRSRLADAAPLVCTLTDASGARIAPDRVLVSRNAGGEIVFLLVHPRESMPTHLRSRFLDMLPAGFFAIFSDETRDAPTRVVLRRDHSGCPLSPSVRP